MTPMDATEFRYYLGVDGDRYNESVFMARRIGGLWYGAFADVLGVSRSRLYGKTLDARGLKPYILTRDPEAAREVVDSVFRRYARGHLEKVGLGEIPDVAGRAPGFREAVALEDGVAILTGSCGRGRSRWLLSVYTADRCVSRYYDDEPELREDLPRIGRDEARRRMISVLRDRWNESLAEYGLGLAETEPMFGGR